jgi:hypothetical protein
MSAASAPTATGVDPVPPEFLSRTDRTRPSVGVTLLPLQLFLLAGWGRAAIEKLIDPTWWSAQHLRAFLDEQRPDMLPWFRWISDHLLEPFAPQVAIAVLGIQLAIAVCLGTNFRVRHALWAGVALNLCFTMAGRVNPSAFYLVMQLTMLFALSRPVTPTIATRRAVLWMMPATLVLPFATTLHPRDVIDDPALMLSFLGVAAAATTLARSYGVAQLFRVVVSTRVGSWGFRFLDRLGVRFDVSVPDLARASPSAISRPGGLS